MMRNREGRLKLQPFTMSQAKCEAVEALPPLPQTKMCRPASRDSLNHSMAWLTLFRSMDSMAFNRSVLYCSGKVINCLLLSLVCPIGRGDWSRQRKNAHEAMRALAAAKSDVSAKHHPGGRP